MTPNKQTEVEEEAAMLAQAELKMLAKREAEVNGRSKHWRDLA